MRVLFTVVLSLQCVSSHAEPYSRAGLREYSLQPFLLDARTHEFAEGARANIDGGYGIGLGFNWHLTDYFAWGVDLSLAEVDYRARITSAGGGGEDANGNIERGTARLTGTWNVLAARTTPFLTAGIGFTHLDPEVEFTPTGGCFNYPFWGRFCGSEPPQHGTTRLSYALGGGIRHDLRAEGGFVRFLISGEWIDWSGTPERLEAIEFRADFGARF